jgi:dipeptidyl-peptidase-3
MNKDQILTKGKKAVGNFLRHLQIYKSTADSVRGEAFFKKYLQVDEKLLTYRDLVIKNKKPRRI